MIATFSSSFYVWLPLWQKPKQKFFKKEHCCGLVVNTVAN
jgi:hypothetical protein